MKRSHVTIKYLRKSKLYYLYTLIGTSTPIYPLVLCEPSTRERSEEGLLDLYEQGLICYYIPTVLLSTSCKPILRRLDDTDH